MSEILTVAQMSRINLDPSGHGKMIREAEAIIKFIKSVSHQQLKQVPPVTLTLDQLACDEITPSVSAQELIKRAPKTRGRFIVVPQTVE